MTLTRLLLDSLRYHARGNLAVGLGAAVGAAVLAGALLVGDSLRGSLRDRADRQLAGTEHALVGGRFFRQNLADQLPGNVRPIILLQGSVRAGDHRVGRVTVIGVDDRFGLGHQTPRGNTATVASSLAAQLNLKPGESIQFTVQKASAIPRASALAKRDTASATRSITLTVGHILPQGHSAGELTLNPGPTPPLNLIVPLQTLQQEIEQPERVNALLSPAQPLEPLQAELERHLTLEDWGLKFDPSPIASYVSFESGRLLLEPGAVAAARKAATDTGYQAAETFVYLANGIASNGAEIPYSVVAGIDPAVDSDLLHGTKLQDDEIALVNWRESPLKVKPGDAVTITYFKPEVEGKIEETKHTFRLKAIIPLEGPTADPDLVPNFPGITDKLEISKWDPPFPYDNTRIKPRDERYWKEHRTTPKAYITLAAARQLWASRFGNTTSVRFTPSKANPVAERPNISDTVLKDLDAKRGGFVFEPVGERARAAAKGSTDFGMLFLSFSFFLIVAALMLVGLLFRLNLERRSREIGLLRATGYRIGTVRWLLLFEGLIVSSIGSAIGLLAAAGFAWAMLKILVAFWPTPGVASFLTLHVSPTSLAIGFIGSILMSEIAIWWAIRALSRIEPSNLLKGLRGDEGVAATPSKWALRIAIAGLVGAIVLSAMAPYVPPGEPRAGTFFGAGSLLLVALLAVVWRWLKQPRRSTVRSLYPLGIRNATRNPTRSLLTAGLLASASFLLVAVESFRREPDRDFREKTSGSGGFALLAESDSPVFVDLNSESMLTDIERAIQRKYQLERKSADERDAKIDEVRRLMQSATIYPFRVRAGDDASCLNLYQASRPRVLGTPDTIIDRGGFRFSSTEAKSADEKANPWLLLRGEDDAIPCFVEENTAIWQLKKGLGDEIEIPDEESRPVRFRIVGLFKDSVFQSEVVIGDAAFRRAFPRTEGYSYFLLDVPSTADARVAEQAFEENLQAYGMEVTPTADRVASYLAVQNTYLTTFQLLGGFGLLLGVLGLAVVLLRNVWERRSELALLQAMGYRVGTVNRLVFIENALVLSLGLVSGVLAALAAVAPHLIGGQSIPWGRLTIMLGAVLIVGLGSAALAVRFSVRLPIVEGLRRE